MCSIHQYPFSSVRESVYCSLVRESVCVLFISTPSAVRESVLYISTPSVTATLGGEFVTTDIHTMVERELLIAVV